MRHNRFAARTLACAATASLAAALLTTPAQGDSTVRRLGAEAAADASARGVRTPITTTRWGPRELRRGTFSHTRADHGIRIGSRPVRVHYDDPFGKTGRLAYQRGRWTSPWTRPGFALSELIASYNADVPVGTFIEISARGRTGGGRTSSWDSLGRWAAHDVRFHRMSLGAQTDDLSRVAVDTMVTNNGVSFASWQLRLSLFRRAGTTKTPTVQRLAAMVSRHPQSSPTSASGPAAGRSLDVPKFSQQIHVGEYPKWDGGGEAWCSPTSTSMVLGYWNRLPTPRQYAWVNDSYRQPWVDHAARYTFAWGYDGTGNWPFNTAYAARFGLDAFVTRLRSLREAEQFIAAGIPLVASIAFDSGELDGAPISSTNGHLLVIRGFTPRGHVIVNDPAAQRAKTVRRVYQRAQFENAWVNRTGGVVYVITPPKKRLPNPAAHSNW